jgi:ABC-type amino acid transport substrate-binding protein
LAILALSTLVACVSTDNSLLVGTSADYAPYEYHLVVDGKDTIVGFDIDIAKFIAAELDKELVIQDIAFDGLLQALNAEKVEMVIAGMAPTEERSKVVDFSDIYYIGSQSILIRAEDAEAYTTLETLEGSKLGAQRGSLQEVLVKEEYSDSELVALGKIPDLIEELKGGNIDALVVETPVAKKYAMAKDSLVISSIGQIGEESGSAIAVKKGNDELLAQINAVIAQLKADGSIEEFVAEAYILSEYFF